jgi:hypothetical protein
MAVADGYREPTASARALARSIRDNFDALVAEGFTEDQALQFLAVWAANIPSGDDDGAE